MLPCSPHPFPRRFRCGAFAMLRPTTKWMHLPCVGHRLKESLGRPMHLFAFRSPVVALGMEGFHHALCIATHSVRLRLNSPRCFFQELVYLSAHFLVIRPELRHHLLSVVPELSPKSYERRTDLTQQLTRILKTTPERRDPVLIISPKLICHLLEIFCDTHSLSPPFPF